MKTDTMKIDFNKQIETPVLFMVFNRPEKTQQVFDVIRSVKPKKIYVAADAPRGNVPDDVKKSKQVREIVSQIDWNCEAKFLFHEKNLGCTKAGITAWDWLFSKEEEMIFIEDDGLISKSFFWFCQEMLNKYRNDNRIAYIGGTNFGDNLGSDTYFFTRYGTPTMAMATWKRTHELYEYELGSLKNTIEKNSFKESFLYKFEYKYYKPRFFKYFKNGGNTYDLQIVYLRYKYNMYNIVPNINFVTNIGLDWGGANNNINPNSKFAKKYGNRKRFEIEEITHPQHFFIDPIFEKKNLINRVFYEKSKLEIMTMVYFPFIYRVYRKLIKTFGFNA